VSTAGPVADGMSTSCGALTASRRVVPNSPLALLLTAVPNKTRMWRFRPVSIHVINPVARLFAAWMPGFGLLTYRGRITGRTYNLPINVFRRGEQYTFVLTYGSESQWVKNVMAAGGCQIRVRGRDVSLVAPELIIDPSWDLVPLLVRLIERPAGVTSFLRMRAA
jgi:deazaflavin-dependent oxidoreductase (nitroreductase family)